MNGDILFFTDTLLHSDARIYLLEHLVIAALRKPYLLSICHLKAQTERLSKILHNQSNNVNIILQGKRHLVAAVVRF